MDETQLRTKLTKALGVRRVLDSEWRMLVEGRYVDEALNPDYPQAFKELVKEAKRLREFLSEATQEMHPAVQGMGRQGPIRGEDLSVGFSDLLSPYERKYAHVVSQYYAREAAFLFPVRDYRTDVLGGTSLSWEEATEFLDNAAPHFLSRTQFAALGIPIVGHHSSIIDEHKDHTDTGRQVHSVTLEIEWLGGKHTASYELEWSEEDPESLRPMWHVISEHVGAGTFRLKKIGPGYSWPDSIRRELCDRTTDLTEWYPWDELGAMMFVLTNVKPEIVPIRIQAVTRERADVDAGVWPLLHDRTAIRMEIDPWVSADTVRRAYRAIRRGILRGVTRQLRGRALTILSFLVNHAEGVNKASWRELMAIWNQSQSDGHDTDAANFARDVTRALGAIGVSPVRKRGRVISQNNSAPKTAHQ